MTVAAGACLTVGVMPVFLVGSLSRSLGEDLGFGSAAAGTAVTFFFASSALTAVVMGGVTDRVGSTLALRAGVTISATVMVLIALVASTWWHLAVFMAAGGAAIGLIDTGGARSFSDSIRAERHGVAFGIKEGSIPAASMLAGLSIPLLTRHLGWGSAFLVAAALAPLVMLLVPAGHATPDADVDAVDEPHDSSTRDGAAASRRTGGLVLFAVGVAAGSAASTSAATLFVPAVADRGWSEDAAGVLLAVASVGCIVVRVLLGWVSDRAAGTTWWLLGGALGCGAVGALLLAVTNQTVVVVAAAILLLGVGWGWSGLAFLSAVRARPDAPALAAGIVLSGLATGGAAGPAAFGILASTWSYQGAWMAGAAAFVVAAALAVFTRSSYRPSQESEPSPTRRGAD